MPELPEVETVRRDLEQVSLHQAIASVDVLLARTIASPSPQAFCDRLSGRQLTAWHRRGKYLLGQLDDGACLGIHLRMTGQLLWSKISDVPLEKHARLRVFVRNGAGLRFVDQRTFGKVWLVPPKVEIAEVITGLALMGPEPLEANFTDVYFIQKLKKSARPIKNALLDQRLVAGIGNIYADEALFLSGIHPLHACNRLSGAQITELRSRVVQVLEESLSQRGTTFSAFRDLSGVNGNYLGQARVYSRKGEPCRQCRTGTIERIKLAGRSAHYCPVCQPHYK
ncbi:MAG: DNA-formamidopyrimidine glycosylase [Cyanobacteria bacterium P01_D01_bin.123]